ncbi:MAG: amidohydrolase family protein [Promethearchaeota archaeon]
MEGKRALEVLERIPVVDSHEHLCPRVEILGEGATLRSILPRAYVGFYDFYPGLASPLGSDGTPLPAGETPVDPASLMIEHPGNAARMYHLPSDARGLADFLGGFSEYHFLPSLRGGLEQIYGVELSRWTPTAIQKLDARIPGTYEEPASEAGVLSEGGNVAHVVLDTPKVGFGLDFSSEEGFDDVPRAPAFHSALRMDSLLFGFDPACWTPSSSLLATAIDQWHLVSEPPGTFDDFLDLVEKIVDWARARFVAFKCAAAYSRTLDFGTRGEFGRDSCSYEVCRGLFGVPIGEADPVDVEVFGNYVVHFILEELEGKAVPVQVHTGMALKSGSRPGLVENIVSSYPGVDFQLLHCGFPWVEEGLSIVRVYENASLNLAWLPQLSPGATRKVLACAIREGFADHVVGFGGDCGCVEGTLGALGIFRRCLAAALLDLVGEGVLGSRDIENVGREVLHDNAARLFHL